MRWFVLSFPTIALVSAALLGCSKEPAPGAVEEVVVEEVDVPSLESSEVTDAMAGLSEADRALALAQKICPVSDEPLGAMGTPIKVTVGDRDVFLCCEGCKESFESEPDKYLAKLDVAK
jgi:YHS domain-containing protein